MAAREIPSRRVIVVGAGISGLAAGIYARKAGHEVTVFERGAGPGGVSTSWSRGGYYFEGGLHWLTGSSSAMGMINGLWKEVGALTDNNPITCADPVYTYVWQQDGKRKELKLWRSLDALRDELMREAPEDRRAIGRLRRDVSLFCTLLDRVKGSPAKRIRKILLLLPAFVRLISLTTFSTERYVAAFKNEAVRSLLGSLINTKHNALSLLYILTCYALGDSGYPRGGSVQMARNMADYLLRLGGRIEYGARVEKVCVEDGFARGVRIADGREIESDCVIVSADTRKAIDALLAEPLKDRWAEKMRRRTESEQCMFITLGIEADLSAYPAALQLHLDRPLEAAGLQFDVLTLYNYAGREGYAPEGCTSVTVLQHAECYEWWAAARSEGRYEREKAAVVGQVVSCLEEALPEIRGKVVVREMATPLTYERFCDTYQGGWMSIWRPRTMPVLLSGRCSIRGLIFTGQRNMLSGGLPIAVQTGRRAARQIV